MDVNRARLMVVVVFKRPLFTDFPAYQGPGPYSKRVRETA